MTIQPPATTKITGDTITPPVGTPPVPTVTPTEGGVGAPATDPPAKDGTPPWGDDFDPARAWQTVQNQRASEAKLKQELSAERAKTEAFEREKLTESERIAADLAAAKADIATAREQAAAARFDAEAIAAGIPADRLTAARAVAGDVVTTDESGTMSIDTTAFDRLKAEHAYLFGSQAAPPATVSFGAAASQGQGGQSGLSADEVAMAKRAGMSAEDWAKYAQRTKR